MRYVLQRRARWKDRMTESTVLDALLGAIIVLVALIGYWQGIVRSLMVIGGTLIGSELALWWSDEAGDRLADVLPFNPDTGRFVASTALIVGSALVLGVLLGNMTSRPPAGRRDRLTGVAVSLVSALLIIGLVIRYFHIHMAARAEDALSDTRLALALWDQFEWIVLVSSVVGVALLILSWVLGAPETGSRGEHDQPSRTSSWASEARSSITTASTRERSPRRPSDHVQTSSNNDHALFGAAGELESLKIEHPAAQQSHSSAPHETRSRIDDETGRTQSLTGSEETRSPGATRTPAGLSADFDRQYAPVASTLAFSDDDNDVNAQSSSGICPNCGMLLKSGDQFCPDCGHPVD